MRFRKTKKKKLFHRSEDAFDIIIVIRTVFNNICLLLRIIFWKRVASVRGQRDNNLTNARFYQRFNYARV